MRILVSTPCSNGMLYDSYVYSLLATRDRATQEGLCERIDVHFQGKESLIHRARNRAANELRLGGYDKLITIDADISWTYEDFKRIITSDKDIIGGFYPLKAFPVVMNFNPLVELGQEFLSSHRGYDIDAFTKIREKYADPNGILEVRNMATGFLAVHARVFAKLSETVDVYGTFQPESGETKGFFDYYPSKVINKNLESEDWGFCRIAKEAGFKIYGDMNVALCHTGYWGFSLGQFHGSVQK